MEGDHEFVSSIISLIRDHGEDSRIPALVASQIREVIEAERERCASIAESFSQIKTLSKERIAMAQTIAEAIRFPE
jgi:hypothetical protein